MAGGARVLVVGLDGATWDVAEPLMEAGRLPHLARLVREGARAPVRSTLPPVTLPAWSTLLTGTLPGKHGLYDFTRRIPGRHRLQVLNSTHRRYPTLLELISARGGRVASVAVPSTYPPSGLNGVEIAGFDSPVALSIDASFCHPPGLWRELVRRFGGMDFAGFQELRIGPGWHGRALACLLEEARRKEEICTWLLGRERWDAFMVVFGESDTVSHHFWAFHDPRSPRRPAVVPPGAGNAIVAVYERLDQALGRLMEEAHPDLACVVSDHGFGGASHRVLHMNAWLAGQGWLQWRRARMPFPGMGALGRVPANLVERAFRAAPPLAVEGAYSLSRYRFLDLAHTQAFSDELNYAPSIHLNVKGRDPSGVVADVDSAARALSDLLLDWRVEGQPVVRKVHRREDLYPGPCMDLAPDLVLELDMPGGYSPSLLPSRPGSPAFRNLGPAEGGKGAGMPGAHRREGLLVLHGRGVARGVGLDAGLQDVAPTLLHLMGEPIPQSMDGHVLEEACAEVPGPGGTCGPVPRRIKEAPYNPQEEAILRKRLSSMGYL